MHLWKIQRLVLWAAVVAGLYFSSVFAVNFSASNLNLSTASEPDSVNVMVRDFCSSVMNSSAFKESGFVYNAQQSVFLHLLCRNFGASSSYFAKEDIYFQRLDFNALWFHDYVNEDGSVNDLCNPNFFKGDCDLARNIPKLFDGIINDYINMKQPNIYGLTQEFISDSDIEYQINQFSSWYFDGLQLCGTDTPRYPKTCKMMKSTFKDVRKALNDVSILNVSGVFSIFKEKSTKTSCDTVTVATDIFYCWLYGNPLSRLVSFTNLVYNELFYYRLFMWYYLSMLQRYPGILYQNTYMKDYTDIQKTFLTQYARSHEALSLSLRMMRDTYIAFPFHVGLSMYHEDLYGLWKSLSSLVSPIDTLSDKLRNVQKP